METNTRKTELTSIKKVLREIKTKTKKGNITAMELIIFTVYDSKSQSFSPPFYSPNLATGERAWHEKVNEKGSPFNSYPNDYSLFETGVFDVHTGIIAPLEAPINRGLAASFIEVPE